MNFLAQAFAKYGPPSNIQDIQTAYGVPNPNPALSIIMVILSLITTPIFIVCSFIIGSILYLITHKKIFIVIPLILSFLYLIRYFILENLLGLSL